ncbi:hypothetical protein LMH87_005940 [Akanthomyces muscarius]|uniref:C2H2-type domain-containing protein n=1 Tax=Akanthomyces muscarius TaxID=2231603 RepID=A0A9W8USN3_AKAMU|nr:hypothetical protein LMH87_005940 [Akanthomyces muscarius]KAJ4164259.1 hypothetical protein LMH87_005940 [Akanthomyces muscarius]
MAQPNPPTPVPSTFSFPSPGAEPTHRQAFTDAVAHAKKMMSSYDAAVLRQAVRELWELTLVGSEYHSSFLCSTMFHRAPPATLSRTVEQHGARLVKHSASQIAKHLKMAELDMIAPLLLPKLSPAFLDKALALRLESIQGQQLVNALGRAERLGYDVRDVVTGNASGPPRQEKVIPTANPIPVPSTSMLPRASQAPQQPGPGSPSVDLPSDQDIMRLGIAFCECCNRPCGGLKALLTHRRSGLCGTLPVPLEKLNKEFCLFCGQQFTTVGGMTYHSRNHVCGRYAEEHADALWKLFTDADQLWKYRQATGEGSSQAYTSSRGVWNSQNSTAATAAAASRKTPAARPSSPQQLPSSKDPYGHLSPNSRQAFDTAMSIVEHKFAEEMKKAMKLPADAQRAEIARVKNLFNNKQSMTRKKFGIRLRERRSRAEIEDERTRMLSSRSGTPASTGKRAFSEVEGTPYSTGNRATSEVRGTSMSTGEHDSTSRQGSPKRILLSEMGNGAPGSPRIADLTDPTSTSATPPEVSQPSAPGTAGATPRPMPMSIAGSYTAPVQAASSAKDTEPIEIDDDDADGNQSGTEMDVDEQADNKDSA